MFHTFLYCVIYVCGLGLIVSGMASMFADDFERGQQVQLMGWALLIFAEVSEISRSLKDSRTKNEQKEEV